MTFLCNIEKCTEVPINSESLQKVCRLKIWKCCLKCQCVQFVLKIWLHQLGIIYLILTDKFPLCSLEVL